MLIFIKMEKKNISEEIELPQDIEVQIDDESVTLKKNNNSLVKKYDGFDIKKGEGKIILHSENGKKTAKKKIMSFKAHIKNMLVGLDKKYVYKLQICAVHFPITASIDKANNEFVIKNFLGEVKARKAKILQNVEVKIDKEIITVESSDLEAAGQTAANIETATKIRLRDRRIFQDGVYITEKPGRQ